ncbi:MAG: arginine-tRNA-protein transferase, partial [Bacteroidota bacterium]
MTYRYVEKLHPFSLSPESLDWYLSRGWYRMGSNIFTTHFLCFQQQLYSAIWIRLDLAGFEFSKSQRKLLRKNAQLFTHRVGFRHITQEKELLYHQYATNFNGRLSPTLRDSLEDYDETPVFNTYETTIRDLQTNALVGASYFDLGSHSAAS